MKLVLFLSAAVNKCPSICGRAEFFGDGLRSGLAHMIAVFRFFKKISQVYITASAVN